MMVFETTPDIFKVGMVKIMRMNDKNETFTTTPHLISLERFHSTYFRPLQFGNYDLDHV